jgi:hypothetical protein
LSHVAADRDHAAIPPEPERGVGNRQVGPVNPELIDLPALRDPGRDSFISVSILARVSDVTVSIHGRPTHCEAVSSWPSAAPSATSRMTPTLSIMSAMSPETANSDAAVRASTSAKTASVTSKAVTELPVVASGFRGPPRRGASRDVEQRTGRRRRPPGIGGDGIRTHIVSQRWVVHEHLPAQQDLHMRIA